MNFSHPWQAIRTMSLIRIWAVANNVFREVVRDRILFVIGFYALLMLAAVRILPDIAGPVKDKVLLVDSAAVDESS